MKKVLFLLVMGYVFSFCNTPSETDQTATDSARATMMDSAVIRDDTVGKTPDTTRPMPDTMRRDSMPRLH